MENLRVITFNLRIGFFFHHKSRYKFERGQGEILNCMTNWLQAQNFKMQ